MCGKLFTKLKRYAKINSIVKRFRWNYINLNGLKLKQFESSNTCSIGLQIHFSFVQDMQLL